MTKNHYQTEVYLIRHAETVMNTNPHLVGGRSNETPLTPRGINQAKRLGRAMLSRQIFPVKVFASPAIRTVDTARYSLAEMGLETEPLVQDALQELGQGVWEGRLRSEAYTDTVLESIARLGKDFKLEGGESMNDVGIRMHGWITEAFERAAARKPARYFVYTHGGAIKCLASHLHGWSHQQTYETEIDNASVSLFAESDGVWKAVYLNRDAEKV